MLETNNHYTPGLVTSHAKATPRDRHLLPPMFLRKVECKARHAKGPFPRNPSRCHSTASSFPFPALLPCVHPFCVLPDHHQVGIRKGCLHALHALHALQKSAGPHVGVELENLPEGLVGRSEASTPQLQQGGLGVNFDRTFQHCAEALDGIQVFLTHRDAWSRFQNSCWGLVLLLESEAWNPVVSPPTLIYPGLDKSCT